MWFGQWGRLVKLNLLVSLLWLNVGPGWADGKSPNLRCKDCNLIIVNMDFLRSDYTGLISDSVLTPNIDRFFSDGIIFENAYSTAGSSYRSSMSVLTATNPHLYALDVAAFERFRSRQILGDWRKIYTHAESLAETLKRHGYTTIAINKGRRSGRGTFMDRGFDQYRQFNIKTLIEDIVPEFSQTIKNAQPPLFAMVHVVPTRLHGAYYPANRAKIDSPHIAYKLYKRHGKPYGYAVNRRTSGSHADQRSAEHQIYQQQLEYGDEEVDFLFRSIEDLLPHSIVILYSGHGTQIGDKQIYASNGVSYESNIRVPLLIKHPNIDQPLRIANRVSLLDFLPTVYDLLGLASESDGLGYSLLDLINNQPYPRRVIYGNNDFDQFVISEGWKLIIRDTSTRALFNLQEDPERQENVINDHVTVAKQLEYCLDKCKADSMPDLGKWAFVKQPGREYELYNLDRDPDEINDLSAVEHETLRSMLSLARELELEAETSIETILAQ